MKLSTRSRYGMRAMVDLASHSENGEPVSLRDIADRQGVSDKYMEHIVSLLRTASLVEGRRGVHGGYVLSRDPKTITAKEIVHVLEGTPLLIECVSAPDVCERSENCPTRPLWSSLEQAMDSALESVSLAELAGQ